LPRPHEGREDPQTNIFHSPHYSVLSSEASSSAEISQIRKQTSSPFYVSYLLTSLFYSTPGRFLATSAFGRFRVRLSAPMACKFLRTRNLRFVFACLLSFVALAMLGAHEAAGNNAADAAGHHAHHGAPALPPARVAVPYFSGDPAFVRRANGVLTKVTNNKFTNISELKYVVLYIDVSAVSRYYLRAYSGARLNYFRGLKPTNNVSQLLPIFGAHRTHITCAYDCAIRKPVYFYCLLILCTQCIYLAPVTQSTYYKI
jgi:hypothetical protein